MSSSDSKDVLSSLAGAGSDKITTRPVIMGTNGMVASGHYLASRIGLSVLEDGGNAVDAGVAMGFALSVLEPYIYGIGGEVPILLYLAKEERVLALSGQGHAPRNSGINAFKNMGIDAIPGDGLLATCVPDAVSTWITALLRFGTMDLARVLTPSWDLARNGFPMYSKLRDAIKASEENFRENWPTSARAYMPEDRIPEVGEIWVQPDLAEMFKKLLDAEGKGRKKGREEGLKASRDIFYKGQIAEDIADFAQNTSWPDSTGKRNSGFLSAEDLGGYATRIEVPVNLEFRGIDVFKCGPWTQGPVFLQQLSILEGYDLGSLGHNSAEYIHLLIETAKLAFADREKYYGDPDFVKVPLDVLLSPEYAAQRRKLIDSNHASMELRPGNAPVSDPERIEGGSDLHRGDTTHLDAVDRWGNMISATPSGGWFRSSPVIEGLGFPLGTRMQMFYLDPDHANALMPGKRPRTTLTPSLAMKDGKPFLVFGTPGGDQQDQWTLQFFLNHVEFGMNLQEAADAPSFHSSHFPASFYPHSADPGGMAAENRIPGKVIEDLRDRGHIVQVVPGWSHGRVLGIRYNADSGVICGAASPRIETGYAMGY